MTEAPTQTSQWRSLRLLQQAMDADIARIYAEAQIEGLKTNWVMELLRLQHSGPMTITELAESVERTHSAMSQKITLTAKAARIISQLAAEWRATEAASAELEAELPYPLSLVITDMETA